MKVALLLLLGAVWQSPSPKPMTTIDKGEQSFVDDARQVVIRSASEWAELWRKHAADRKQPNVDFGRQMVVGVFLGSKSTSGYGVEIVGTREDRNALVVEYRETQPSRDAMTAQIITMPYHLVAIPKRAGDVRFEKTK